MNGDRHLCRLLTSTNAALNPVTHSLTKPAEGDLCSTPPSLLVNTP
jgi:hypothetical protein